MLTNGDIHRTMTNRGVATTMLLFIRMAEAGLFEGQDDEEIVDSLEFYLNADAANGGKATAVDYQLHKLMSA